MRPPQGFEWLLILVIVLLLFGAKRLPDMARGLGRSLRILKAETRGLVDDGSEEATDVTDARPATGTAPAALPEGPAAKASPNAPDPDKMGSAESRPTSG